MNNCTDFLPLQIKTPKLTFIEWLKMLENNNTHRVNNHCFITIFYDEGERKTKAIII